MLRDPQALSQDPFDIVVVGGGIHGAAACYDAALRGFRTALIEKSDFGSATSAGSFKIIHGGLRYLQHFDLARLNQSVNEQRTLRIIAPHLVQPLPFLVPCYGWGMKGREALSLGVLLYDFLSRHKNDGVDQSRVLPDARRLTVDQCRAIAPSLSLHRLRGGVVYHDCQMSNPDRLTFAVVKAAASAGAMVCNYLKVVAPLERDAHRVGVVAEDQLTGRRYDIRAKLVVLACGPWNKIVEAILAKRDAERTSNEQAYSKGIQVVLPSLLQNHAVAVESGYVDPEASVRRGGRSYFLQPWRGHTLVGTTDTIYRGNPDAFCITEGEVSSFIDEVQEAYPDSRISAANVRYAFGGLRPLSEQWSGNDQGGGAKAARDDRIESPLPGVISVYGVKYTTFRAVAEQVINRAEEILQQRRGVCKTHVTLLPGGRRVQPSHFSALADTDSAEVLRLMQYYGEDFEVLMKQATPAVADSRLSAVRIAEARYVIRFEQAVTLQDVVVRRTDLGTLGYPGDHIVFPLADLMAAELGWDGLRRKEEIARVTEFYRRC